MNRNSVTEQIISLLAELQSADKASIHPDMALMGKDLGLDSLGWLRLVLRLSEDFPDRIDSDCLLELQGATVNGLVDMLVDEAPLSATPA